MKQYKIFVTPTAKADLRKYLSYVRYKLKNLTAARNLAKDYRETIDSLKDLAGGIKDPDSKALISRGLKRINFNRHDYFLLYRVIDNTVEITNMFHMLEDYENKLS